MHSQLDGGKAVALFPLFLQQMIVNHAPDRPPHRVSLIPTGIPSGSHAARTPVIRFQEAGVGRRRAKEVEKSPYFVCRRLLGFWGGVGVGVGGLLLHFNFNAQVGEGNIDV